MTRESAEDFNNLTEYLSVYNLAESVGDPRYIESLKQQHKKYLAILTWTVELNNDRAKFEALYPGVTSEVCDRLVESASDLSAALFNWIHGNYKCTRIMTRAAVENYIRGISGIWDPTALTETSVYSLFEKAAALTILSSDPNKGLFDALHGDYKLLCSDTHTSTESNMAKISSLAEFPSYVEDRANSTKIIYLRVLTNQLLLSGVLFSEYFYSFHYKNREIIMGAIPESKKSLISCRSVITKGICRYNYRATLSQHFTS